LIVPVRVSVSAALIATAASAAGARTSIALVIVPREVNRFNVNLLISVVAAVLLIAWICGSSHALIALVLVVFDKQVGVRIKEQRESSSLPALQLRSATARVDSLADIATRLLLNWNYIINSCRRN
jgi:hypothetical protein